MTKVPVVSSPTMLPDSATPTLSRSVLKPRINWPAWLVVMLAVLLVVVEGALRKWVGLFDSGGLRYLAYFSKDIVFGLLLLLPLRGIKTPALAQFGKWLAVGCLLCLAGAGVSCFSGFNAVGSVLTLRAMVVLPVVAFLAVRRLGGVSVRHVAWLLAVLTVLNFGLSLVQNQLPADHFLNKYATEMDFVVELESGVRATGTFSFITGLGLMSSVGVWAGLALLSISSRLWDQMAGFAAIAAGFGCGLASVSRAPLIIDAVMVLVWMLLSHSGHRVLGRSLLAALLVAVAAWGSGLFDTFYRLGGDMLTRHMEAGDTVQDRGFGQLEEMLEVIQVAPLGRGLGTEQVGGNYAQSGEMTFTRFETQLPRVVVETGMLGLAGFLVVSAGALIALQRARREAISPENSSLILATQLLLLPMFYSNVIFNHTASAFVWIIFTIVLASIRAAPDSGSRKTSP